MADRRRRLNVGTGPDGDIRRWAVRLPGSTTGPLRKMADRLLMALLVLFATFLLVFADRDGYRDSVDGEVSAIDAIYYATVTLSTTGYGDIVPATPGARLSNVLLITPLRFIFLVILVGTTFEVLAERTRTQWRVDRWRSRLREHTVVIGYGTKGQGAVSTLLATGYPKDQIVVVDRDGGHIAEAIASGLAAVTGDATHNAVLRQASLDRADRIVVATDRDDTTVLVTLTARQLNPSATVVAAVRESENVPLVRQSGADAVITSSEAAGRLLGVATASPAVSDVFDDLLNQGKGLDLIERKVTADEVGRPLHADRDIVLAVVRGSVIMRFDTVDQLATDDRVVVVRSRRDT
ncbi:MAG: potassium channel family protein [Sporichthyaceae bacterium]|nr:potassium channel family protein [Sporichthyaceae bacterium]